MAAASKHQYVRQEVRHHSSSLGHPCSAVILRLNTSPAARLRVARRAGTDPDSSHIKTILEVVQFFWTLDMPLPVETRWVFMMSVATPHFTPVALRMTLRPHVRTPLYRSPSSPARNVDTFPAAARQLVRLQSNIGKSGPQLPRNVTHRSALPSGTMPHHLLNSVSLLRRKRGGIASLAGCLAFAMELSICRVSIATSFVCPRARREWLRTGMATIAACVLFKRGESWVPPHTDCTAPPLSSEESEPPLCGRSYGAQPFSCIFRRMDWARIAALGVDIRALSQPAEWSLISQHILTPAFFERSPSPSFTLHLLDSCLSAMNRNTFNDHYYAYPTNQPSYSDAGERALRHDDSHTNSDNLDLPVMIYLKHSGDTKLNGRYADVNICMHGARDRGHHDDAIYHSKEARRHFIYRMWTAPETHWDCTYAVTSLLVQICARHEDPEERGGWRTVAEICWKPQNRNKGSEVVWQPSKDFNPEDVSATASAWMPRKMVDKQSQFYRQVRQGLYSKVNVWTNMYLAKYRKIWIGQHCYQWHPKADWSNPQPQQPIVLRKHGYGPSPSGGREIAAIVNDFSPTQTAIKVLEPDLLQHENLLDCAYLTGMSVQPLIIGDEGTSAERRPRVVDRSPWVHLPNIARRTCAGV
ncbi:hypothetical protein K466DRAFT_570652 [Polyporus arcularius HHB13444]|uniref:Uncharacterized protein n=1 Tax=Polyporus arcularius HHB13444 TaxID=1314778 RepID=A0A5C3NRY9_9APHY|nr:hypothetical protein K466DRAFT_570652 [Polyporus arcularius HHB13444]